MKLKQNDTGAMATSMTLFLLGSIDFWCGENENFVRRGRMSKFLAGGGGTTPFPQ